MGYLDKTETTVDAVLTKLGRQYITSGKPFEITKFALGDDEIDYTLWDTTQNNPGKWIEALPVFEALIDENVGFRSKLLTLNPNINVIPYIIVDVASIDINMGSANAVRETVVTISSNPVSSNTSFYVVLMDDAAGSLRRIPGRPDQFAFVPIQSIATTITTEIVVIGEETGARLSIPVTVQASLQPTSGTYLTSTT